MEVAVRCPSCGGRLHVTAGVETESVQCGRCGERIDLAFSDAVKADEAVDACAVCGGADFYVRKDFDQKTGVLIVVAGGLISAVFYWFGFDLIAYGVLGLAVLVDLVVARWLGEVTACYRCHAEYRGNFPPTAPAFDLHTADVLEEEYRRRAPRRA